MQIQKIHKFLTTPQNKASQGNWIFWFTLSMTFSILYGLPVLQKAFSSEYVVASDARQFVFWMPRFLDAELFPNDLIADYFQSVTPSGYKVLYAIAAFVGLEPMFFNKLLPILLGLITTVYTFGACLELLPIPMTGFIGTLLLNQTLWMDGRLVCAVPRSFVYPLFMAFLYYFFRRSFFGTGIAIALLGLFYPQYVFIAVVLLILHLFIWKNSQIKLSQNRQDYWFSAIGLTVAFLVMLPYALQTSEFGPVITVAQAKALPEFLEAGRTRFFINNPIEYWLFAERTGLLSVMMPLCLVGLALPVMLQKADQFPLVKQVSDKVIGLAQLTLAAFLMFFAAHLLLFKLHLPSRYVQHSFAIILSLAGAIALTILIDWLWFRTYKKGENSQNQSLQAAKKKHHFALVGSGILFALLAGFPGIWLLLGYEFPHDSYKVGNQPEVYQFFAQQPKDIVIASLSEEANKIPSFSQRSILVGRKYAVPYHVGYYTEFRERSLDLIRAQYTPNLGGLQEIIQKYSIDFWLIEREEFTPEYVKNDSWMQQYQSVAQQAQTTLYQGQTPALVSAFENCSALNTERSVIVDTNCILENSRPSS